MDEAVCSSFRANEFEKGMSLSLIRSHFMLRVNSWADWGLEPLYGNQSLNSMTLCRIIGRSLSKSIINDLSNNIKSGLELLAYYLELP